MRGWVHSSRVKRVCAGFIAVVSIIFLIQGASACPKWEIFFKLYSEQDSNIAAWDNPDEDIWVCYREVFGYGYNEGYNANVKGYRDCKGDGSNVILRVYGDVNANNVRVESPSGTSEDYVPLCYGDLKCALKAPNEDCDSPSKIIAYLSGVTNAKLSKIAIPGWYQLCCKTNVCNDGIVDEGEECDGEGSDCTYGGKVGVCGDDCTCNAPAQAPEIYGAVWKDSQGAVVYELPKDELNIQMLNIKAKTQGYSEGDGFSLEFYQITHASRLGGLNHVFTSSLGDLSFGELFLINSGPGSILPAGHMPEVGDKFYFRISDENDPLIFNISNNITVSPAGAEAVTNLVDYCSDIKMDENDPDEEGAEELAASLCSISVPKDSWTQDCKRKSCIWNEVSKTCDTLEDSLDPLNGEVIESCQFTPEDGTDCDNSGFRTVDLRARVIKTGSYPESYPEECKKVCQDKADIKIPCGRSFVLLPFFTSWEIIFPLIILFFIYLILVKTGMIGKKNKNKRKKAVHV